MTTSDIIDYCYELKTKVTQLEMFQKNVIEEANRLGWAMQGQPEIAECPGSLMDAAGKTIARLKQERDEARRQLAVQETSNGVLSASHD